MYYVLCAVFIPVLRGCFSPGVANQALSYVGDQLILNYTNGEICHKVYQRSTEIYFSCHPDKNPVSLAHKRRLGLQLIL